MVRILFLLLPFSIGAAAAAAEPILGALESGPHAVGYRVLPVTDPSRPTGPKRDGGAAPDARARRLAVHVWYPAASGTGPAMTLGDYAGTGAAAHRDFVGRLFPPALTDAEWSAYAAGRMIARRDASPASGRHPLLVGSFRPMSLTLTSEFLASHGYVVAFVQSPPPDDIAADGAVFEALQMTDQIRDIEVAVAEMRRQAFVDPGPLGAMGFSGSGLAPVPLAMRNRDVDAVAQIDTGYFGPQGSSYRALPAYDPAVLRAPYFYAYGAATLAQPDLHQAELKRMRYAPRTIVFAGEPRLHHWDFATEGHAVITLLNRRPDARDSVRRVAAAVHRHLLTFLDAHVRSDERARRSLQGTVVEPGPGSMIERQVVPAIEPALSRRGFRRLLEEDTARAVRQAAADLERDPEASLFEEAYLNTLGYELLNQRQGAKALEVLRLNAAAHPRSANALDSLSEALEATGHAAEALEWAEKALVALPNDASLPAAQRKPLENGLRARIGRLKR